MVFVFYLLILLSNTISISYDVLLKSNTIDVTNGAGTAYPSGTSKFTTVSVGLVKLDVWFSVKCFADRCLSFWLLGCMSFSDLRILITRWYRQTLLKIIM